MFFQHFFYSRRFSLGSELKRVEYKNRNIFYTIVWMVYRKKKLKTCAQAKLPYLSELNPS